MLVTHCSTLTNMIALIALRCQTPRLEVSQWRFFPRKANRAGPKTRIMLSGQRQANAPRTLCMSSRQPSSDPRRIVQRNNVKTAAETGCMTRRNTPYSICLRLLSAYRFDCSGDGVMYLPVKPCGLIWPAAAHPQKLEPTTVSATSADVVNTAPTPIDSGDANVAARPAAARLPAALWEQGTWLSRLPEHRWWPGGRVCERRSCPHGVDTGAAATASRSGAGGGRPARRS